jgi:hypothetical protein
MSAAERTADILGGIHGWTPAQRTAMLDEYRAEVDLSRRWRRT